MAEEVAVRAVGFEIAAERMKAIKDGMDPAAFDATRNMTLYLQRTVRDVIRERFNRGTGEFERSFNATVVHVDRSHNVGIVGSAHPGARIHELGGTIRPVKAGALAIPFGGLPRRRRPGDFPDAFILKTSQRTGSAGAFLVQKSASGRLTFLYSLVQKVELPARAYLQSAADRAQPGMDKIAGRSVEVRLDPTGAGIPT